MAQISKEDDYSTVKDDISFDHISSPTEEDGGLESTVPDETPEEREQRMGELKVELEKVESEIAMLRQVLGSKVRHSNELKRQLGITPFQEFKNDLQLGLEQIKKSDSYQKTTAVVKSASVKTSSAINSVGQAVARKMGDLKKSQAFKSFDERVHTTYASVKAKVTGSQSSGEIDNAFKDAQGQGDGAHAPEAGEDATKAQLP